MATIVRRRGKEEDALCVSKEATGEENSRYRIVDRKAEKAMKTPTSGWKRSGYVLWRSDGGRIGT